jgi:UDP-2-acetamido-3-amino-2,3-dideoxy-glucuronate N-acetyltransferase
MAPGSVRLGVVGLGGWGKNVVRSFAGAKNCELAYICDSNPRTLAQYRDLYPQAQASDSYERLLADPSIDALALVTPAPAHATMVRQALLAGKHVFVEKPMALTEADALEMCELSEQLNLKLMVGHLLHYHPAVE